MNPNDMSGKKDQLLSMKLKKALQDIGHLSKMLSQPGRSPEELALVSGILRKRTAAASALLNASMGAGAPANDIPSIPAGRTKELPLAPVGGAGKPENQFHIDDEKIEETTSVAGGDIQGTAAPGFANLDMRDKRNESKDVRAFRKYIRNLLEQLYIQDRKLIMEFAPNDFNQNLEDSENDFGPSGDGLLPGMQGPRFDQSDNDMSQVPGEENILNQSDESLGSTGIEHLDELFNNIRPVIEKTYARLKSSRNQRVSYAIHLKKAIQDQLEMLDLNTSAEMIAGRNGGSNSGAASINLNQNRNPNELPSTDPKADQEKQKIDKFTVPGLNETGRNFALKTFEDISSQIEKAFKLIGAEDQEDRENFKTYLLKNIVLLFKHLEEQLETARQSNSNQSEAGNVANPAQTQGAPQQKIGQ